MCVPETHEHLTVPITRWEILVAWGRECDESHDESDDSCEDKYDSHGPIWSCTPPSTEYLMATWTREPRNNQKLCEWTDHERGEWRGDILHRLSESKYSSLAFERYYFLHYGLFSRFDNRWKHHKKEKSKSYYPNWRNDRKQYACYPYNKISK